MNIAKNSIIIIPAILNILKKIAWKIREPTGIGTDFKLLMKGSKELLKFSKERYFIYGYQELPSPTLSKITLTDKVSLKK